jgi:DNA-binding transcriptional MocR family regulator
LVTVKESYFQSGQTAVAVAGSGKVTLVDCAFHTLGEHDRPAHGISGRCVAGIPGTRQLVAILVERPPVTKSDHPVSSYNHWIERYPRRRAWTRSGAYNCRDQRPHRQTPGTFPGRVCPPPAALKAAAGAVAETSTHDYQPASGQPALIAAIEQKLRRDNGIDLTRGSRIMVTAGANMAFVHAVLAITSPDDEVILPVPFYFNHEMAVQMASCRVVPVPTDSGYQLMLTPCAR